MSATPDTIPEASGEEVVVLHHVPEEESGEDDEKERASIGRWRSRVQLIALGLLVAAVSYDSCKDCNSCNCPSKSSKKSGDKRSHIPPNWPPVESGESESGRIKLPKKPEKAKSSDLDAQSHEEVLDSVKEGIKSEGVLVVAYSQQELSLNLREFGKTLSRRRKRQPDYPAKFERGPARGVYKLVVNTLDERNRKVQVPVYFMTSRTLQSSEGSRFLQDKKFSYVQLRGHYSRRYNIDQMTPLIDTVKKHRKGGASLLNLGGCKASVFQKSVCSARTPLLAQKGIGYTERNNYLLLRSIDEIMGQNSWGSMYRAIGEESPIARNGNQDYIPGQSGYGQGCPSWNQFPNRVSRRGVRRKIASLRQERDKWKQWRTQIVRIKRTFSDRRKIAYIDKQIAEANEQVRQFAQLIESWKKRTTRRRRKRTTSLFVQENQTVRSPRTERNRRRRMRRRRRR